MQSMKFVTFRQQNRTSAGLLVDKSVIDLGKEFDIKPRDLKDVLEAGGQEKIKRLDLKKLAHSSKCSVPLGKVKIVAPILRPPKIMCVGLNYRDHAEEQKQPIPESPLLFSKASNVVVGSDDTIRLPAASNQVDYEVELAVVIGKEAFQVKQKDALKYVFGYTIMNDVSARDVQFSDKQWFRAKSFATFAPLGPVVVTPDEIDVNNLDVSLRLNGKVMQKSNTSNLIFNVPYIIEFISACFPLEVGDVISTGTPGGVGVFREPKVFLKSGDMVEAIIGGIGTLRNLVE